MFLSHLAFTTFATPIESKLSPDVFDKYPLVARQKGTDHYTDANVNESLAGTYDCFKGGTWALQKSIDEPIVRVCGGSAYQTRVFTPLILEPIADGTYPPSASVYQLSENCFTDSVDCDPSGTKGTYYLYFNADIRASLHAVPEYCEYALGRVRDLCHGENSWSRGGWFTFIDGTSYGVDPSKNGGSE